MKEKKTCTTCNGEGQVKITDVDKKGWVTVVWVDCRDCDGKGVKDA